MIDLGYYGDDSLPDSEGVYLIHADAPFGKRGVQHYLGWSNNVRRRVRVHRTAGGKAARLLAAFSEAGIGWHVVRVWEGEDRTFEAKLKKSKKSFARLCPTCEKVM